MDEIDRSILMILRKDARTAYSEIAKAVGLSDVAVHKRVKRMIEEGYIKKFTIVLDEEKLGYGLSGFVEIKAAPNKIQDVLESLQKMDNVREIYTLIGDYNILVKIRARDLNELKEIVEKRIYVLDGVLDARPYVVSQKIKDELESPLPI